MIGPQRGSVTTVAVLDGVGRTGQNERLEIARAAFRRRQVAVLYRHAWISLTASFLTASVLFAILASQVPPPRLLLWYAATVVIVVVRSCGYYAYRTFQTVGKIDPETWLDRFRIGACISGFVWGIAGSYIVPLDQVSAQMFTLLCVGGLIAGAIGAYAIDLASFVAFVGPATALMICRYLFLPTPLSSAIAGMICVFSGMMFLYAVRLNHSLLQTLRLEFSNDHLLRRLDAEHRSLEERVAARTVELEQANAQLETEITRSRELALQLSHQATHDNLTELINRAEFERRLNRLLERVQQEQSEHVLCYLDLDQFKIVNDTCGHSAGDALLRQFAVIIRDHFRQRDTLARLGGDEFGILMEHCKLDQAHRTADRVYAFLNSYRFTWEDKIFTVGMSMGMIPITASSGSVTEVMQQVDVACYEAKDQGRNRLHIIDTPSSISGNRRQGEFQWVTRIERALEEDRFMLYFQPIEALTGPRSPHAHYETLIRLIDEQQAIVEPAVFLPVVERYNLAAKLDRWVVSNLLAWLEQQPEHLDKLHLCSVNLSGSSLDNPVFIDFLLNAIASTSVPAAKLCFEITETAAISNLHHVSDLVKTLHSHGCSFALDDFGSGWSSFSHLRALPVDYLKIDGTFVRDIVDDSVALAMVKSINEIGQLLDIKTVAEYVINDSVKERLLSIGVNYVQGYGIGRPQPLDAVMGRGTAARH